MFSILRNAVARRSPTLASSTRRTLATETTLPDNTSTQFLEEAKRRGLSLSTPEPETEEQQQERFEQFLKEKEAEKPSRPQRKATVNPDHGLWAFFRKVERDGKEEFETVERDVPGRTIGSRAWNAFELRRKSFKDLHTLWYIVLRERNLLASQRAEAKRLEINVTMLSAAKRDYMCRKTMARIKQVLNERRIAYERAVAIRQEEFSTEGEEGAEEVTLDQRTSSKRAIPRRSVADVATFRANNPTEPKHAEESGEAVEEGAMATTKVDASA
ncbi:MRP-L47-domain-containing protein [Schizopora paradoxa]|uniref:Large ribosomal subunit protein uL29m n=1 Tax=Schizopora paradoxa TaxID=27342 RepID=A0A0H2RL47_9AGAM|nr:MRP-L47-domain-containing protein [Schizopora paradoxa]